VSGLTVDLRWPNDLLLGPRKTGGILVEARTEPDKIAYAVIGIGINVHQREFAPGLATPATSLDLESGRCTSRQELLVALLKSLELEMRSYYVAHAFETIPAALKRPQPGSVVNAFTFTARRRVRGLQRDWICTVSSSTDGKRTGYRANRRSARRRRRRNGYKLRTPCCWLSM